MTIFELSNEQLLELKSALLTRIYDEMLNTEPSWDEIASADQIISDGLLVAFYGETTFCDADFFCSIHS